MSRTPGVPVEFRVFRQRASRRFQARRRAFCESLRLDHRLRDPAVRRRGIWAVTVVRNEADIIGQVVEHLIRQGVEAIIVADNRSDDGTRQALERAAVDAPIYVCSDPIDAFYQDVKMTVLAEIARDLGAEWVVPFDADELWFARGETLSEHLRRSDDDVVTAKIHNVFPSWDDPPANDPLVRLRHMDRKPHYLEKVAFRPRSLFYLGMGNHRVDVRGTVGNGLFVAHFPWRDREQVRRKVLQGTRGLEKANLTSETSVHWRRVAAWSEAELIDGWDQLLAGHRVREMAWYPRGRLEEVDVTTWTSWELE